MEPWNYMHRRVDFIQKASQRKVIRVLKIDTTENKADVLTKVLAPRQFARMRNKMQNVRHGVRVSTHCVRAVRFTR